MGTTKTHLLLIAIVGTLGFGACNVAPEDDSVAVQEAQDRAWGFKRDNAAPAHFLVENGKGSLAETNAYYAQTVEKFAADVPYTLDTWQSQYITEKTVSAFYRNRTELGFWRDMTCTETIRRGVGGCMVTNYKNETDKAQQRPNLGTVAMNVSPEGFSRFYVFLPNGLLSPTALLDDEGPKFAPRLCTVCHGGGRGAAPDKNPDLGSIFREFETSQLQGQTGLSHPAAEAQWFALNQAIRTANQSIRGESEGGPVGVDHAKAAMSAHLDGLYPDLAPPARPLSDPALVPVSWQSEPANTKLWNAVVAPYCMGCHRHNADDWSLYPNFEFLQQARDGAALLRQYVSGVNGAHPYDFMPQSQLGYTRLTADRAAQSAINAWLPCISGQACAPANACHTGATVCHTDGTSSCKDTHHNVADGTACGDHSVCTHGTCTASPCQPKVLVLGDAADGDSDLTQMTSALTTAGLQPTLIGDGTLSFTGAQFSAGDFGAVLVTPGRTYSNDMPTTGQSAIVDQAARGIGVVFTQWSSFEVQQGRYQQLAPLMLISESSTDASTLTFTLTSDGQPIWTGLPTTFSTNISGMGFVTGSLINGGVAIASVTGNGGSTTSGVAVRESSGGNGRVVHLNHAASYVTGWGNDPNLLLMFTNAMRWAAHCE